MEGVLEDEKDLAEDPLFDNLSNGLWSPRKKTPLTGLERWSGFIFRSVLSWTFFLILGVFLSIIGRAMGKFFGWWGEAYEDLMLVLSLTLILVIGGSLILLMVYREKKFQKVFSRDMGNWYFSTVHSEPIEVDGLAESAENHLKELGLKIITIDKGTRSRRTRFMRVDETPIMVLLSYDLTPDDFLMEVEIGPSRRAFRKEMVTLMGHMRDWSKLELMGRIGDLGPDPRDPGKIKVKPQRSAS